MCGRYRLSTKAPRREVFRRIRGRRLESTLQHRPDATNPRHTSASERTEPRAVPDAVGIDSVLAKDMSVAAGTINARSETAALKPVFRNPMKFRRCLVPADGFYEWRRSDKTKQPFCFEVNGGELFGFEGLWDRWRDPSGEWIKSCSILTTTSNAVTSVVHDRMPVILQRDDYDVWLDPGMNNVEALSDLLNPFDARLMRSYVVSSRVNQVLNTVEGLSRR
jgi:putative SOS response-associated peptidase YedK